MQTSSRRKGKGRSTGKGKAKISPHHRQTATKGKKNRKAKGRGQKLEQRLQQLELPMADRMDNNNNNNNNNNNSYYQNNKGKSRGRGDKAKGSSKGRLYCSVCLRFGHSTSQSYYNACNTNNIQQALPAPHQQFSPNNHILDVPVAGFPRDQLPVIYQHGQLQSRVPFQTSCAPSQATSTSTGMSTHRGQWSMTYDISFVDFDHIIDQLDGKSIKIFQQNG